LTPIEPEKYYHVYNRGNNNEIIFKEIENYHYFLRLTRKYLLPVAEIFSYALMSNHFHFVIRIRSAEKIPERYKTKPSLAFSNLFNAYTKAVNKRYGRKGSLFEKNFKRIEIADEEYLKNLILYVNTNAEHHDVDKAENYPFSSLLGILRNNNHIVNNQEIIRLFDSIENFEYSIKQKRINIELIKNFLLE